MSDRGHKVRTLWLAGILHAFTHVYQLALAPLYLLIQKDFKLASVEQATLLVTVLNVAYYLPSYPMGVLADRVSRKKLLTIGLAINGLAFVGLGLAPNYGWALVWVIVAGFGGSFFHPAATALIARLHPAETGRALGLVAIGASAGFCISPIYTGWRADMLGNWRTPIIELGALGIVMAGVFQWLAEEERGPVKIACPAAPAEKLFPTAGLWVFFIAAGIAFSLRDFTGSGMTSLGSLFLQKSQGFTAHGTGLALSGIFLVSMISNPLFGRLSDGGRIRWAVVMLLLAFVMVAIFPRLPRIWIAPALMVYGFFFQANYPIVEAAVMESVPDAVRGRVFGLFITMGGMLGNLSHWLMGAAVKRLGPDAAQPQGYYGLYAFLALLILLSLAGLPCLHAIRKREGLEEAVPPGMETVKVPDSGAIIE